MKMRPRNVSKDNDTDSELLPKYDLELTGRLASKAYTGCENTKKTNKYRSNVTATAS